MRLYFVELIKNEQLVIFYGYIHVHFFFHLTIELILFLLPNI
jgi:hypothetical protein